MRISTKGNDEKHSPFEDSVTQTWFTSAANVTCETSEKLLAWSGGTGCVSYRESSKMAKPDQTTSCGIPQTQSIFSRVT